MTLNRVIKKDQIHCLVPRVTYLLIPPPDQKSKLNYTSIKLETAFSS